MTPTPGLLSVVARRTIRAARERVFAAWTRPEHLVNWWGPTGVECAAAEVDLREGGGFRLANQLPDGTVIWIAGTYSTVNPPEELAYSWYHEPLSESSEVSAVRVRFMAKGDATEVVVLHEGFADAASQERHGAGWQGCLDGLQALSSALA